MATRSCFVKPHVRSLPDRLDTKTHRQLAAEVTFMKKVDRLDEELADYLARELEGFDPLTGGLV